MQITLKLQEILEQSGVKVRSDEEKLKTDSYQSQLAWGIYIGIQKYFTEE